MAEADVKLFPYKLLRGTHIEQGKTYHKGDIVWSRSETLVEKLGSEKFMKIVEQPATVLTPPSPAPQKASKSK